MNGDSLKSELQQVLDNDVMLRKEFNALKRSLSDYRNQLIMRDEDCKRLQVTIDVLNTKLVVVERDCNTYKTELTSFKELRGTIQEQLQAKQEEIDARLTEIQGLRDDLNSMAAGYEQQVTALKEESGLELAQVKQQYVDHLEALRMTMDQKEMAIRTEYENKAAELSSGWSGKEQELVQLHDEAMGRIKELHAEEINSLNEQFMAQLTTVSSGNHEEVANLKLHHETTVARMADDFESRLAAIEEGHQGEMLRLKDALEEQWHTLTTNFNANLENLSAEFVTREQSTLNTYQEQIEALKADSASQSNQLTESFQQQIAGLEEVHQRHTTEINSQHEARINHLIQEYEDKLSNTLIHSNAQNSRLQEELSKAQTSSDHTADVVEAMNREAADKNSEIVSLTARLGEAEFQLRNEAERLLMVTAELETLRQQVGPTDEKINELNLQIAALNLSHSDYVLELNGTIDGLNTEIRNMSEVFEKTTNDLSEAELTIELRTQELEAASKQIDSLLASAADENSSIDQVRAETEALFRQQMKDNALEYEKLLAENANLINEIDLAQDKVEAHEATIDILNAELEEARVHSAGKAEFFKETLSSKNFEITNLEANNAAYQQEIMQLKKEALELRERVEGESATGEILTGLQHNYELLLGEKQQLLAEIMALTHTIESINESARGVNEKLKGYEMELGELKSAAKNEDEAFIDRLFKQIDALNDERLVLLDEKEQMAGQLLKMNEVVHNISQQVDTENIDVTGLNNHRKNVILATNSEGNSLTKKQINDLVREIDKCIALLSA